MVRRFTGSRLVIASHNAGKLREIGELLAPYGVGVVSAVDLNLPEPEESGKTFRDNAALKARAAALTADLPALADDSGLVVAALGGAPGIHSARWAEHGDANAGRDFTAAMARVERALERHADRRARFRAALALCWPDAHCEIFEGQVSGDLVFPPRGARGFGYDPIFLPDGYHVTFGEMEPAEKHRISHRADAFAKLVAACFGSKVAR